jgi:hypothetical protein
VTTTTNAELIAAVKAGDVDLVSQLIRGGADVNARSEEQEWPALCLAAGKGSLEIVEILVDKGADVFMTGRDLRTPYKIAIAAGRVRTARFLEEAEARVGGDRDGVSSLQWRRRPYCKAYTSESLGPFRPGDVEEQAVVFIHDDWSVTRSIWRGEDILLDGAAPEWQEFCRSVLGFRVPNDYDLAANPTGE